MASTKTKVNGSTVKVIAGKNYISPGNVLLKVKDTDNGLIAKFPAWRSTEQDYYICLDYAQAAYLYEALREYDEMGYFGDD